MNKQDWRLTIFIVITNLDYFIYSDIINQAIDFQNFHQGYKISYHGNGTENNMLRLFYIIHAMAVFWSILWCDIES